MVNSGYRRSDRVEASVQRAVSEIIARALPEELPALVTVTAVRTSPDLRHANIFVACFSGDEDLVELSFSKLLSMQGFIRSLLPRYAPMKYVPNLHFERDDQVAFGTRVVSDLGRLVKEADARPGHERDDDGTDT